MNQPNQVTIQEVIDFFCNYFKITPEQAVIKRSSVSWIISDEPSSFGYTTGGYRILSKNRKFFMSGNKAGEPAILEDTRPDKSGHHGIEQYDKVLIKIPRIGITPSIWSSVEEIKDLITRMRETTFLRIKKEIWQDGIPTGKAQIIGIHSLDNFIEHSGSRFQDYASDINPKMSFVFTFEQKDPGGEWRSVCDPRSIISR